MYDRVRRDRLDHKRISPLLFSSTYSPQSSIKLWTMIKDVCANHQYKCTSFSNANLFNRVFELKVLYRWRLPDTLGTSSLKDVDQFYFTCKKNAVEARKFHKVIK